MALGLINIYFNNSLVIHKLENITIIIVKVYNLLFLVNNNNFHNFNFILTFYDNLASAIVYEMFFKDEFNIAKKQILQNLTDLKPTTDDMTDEEKLAIIQSEFERLYDPGHPVRNNLETLDSIEEVRIIREALK